MGTAGVTHIKKNNKIIPLSDGHDGYLSGMGQSNLLGIKHGSLQKIKELFDQYTAIPALTQEDINKRNYEDNYNEDDVVLSTREIENALFVFSEDSNHDKEKMEWFKNRITDDYVRASLAGFLPLLYLNIDPYGARDYEFYDYLVDLDKEEIILEHIYTIPFSIIDKITPEHIRYFTDQELSLLETDMTSKDLYELTNQAKILGYESNKTKEDEQKFIEIKKQLKEYQDKVFSIPDNIVQNYYAKIDLAREQSRQQYREMEKLHAQHNDDDKEGYNIFNASHVKAPQLRLMLAFLHELIKVKPEANFMLENADWGFYDEYNEGGIRFFSPHKKSQSILFNEIIQVFQYQYKIGMNIFASSGSWSKDIVEDETKDPIERMFDDESPGPEESLVSLEKFNQFEFAEQVKEICHPYLYYHVNHQDMKNFVMNSTNITMPVFFTYVALLHQDKDMLEKVYPLMKQQFKEFNEMDQKKVANITLQSISDGQAIQKSLEELLEVNHQAKSDAFITYLQETELLKDMSPYMNTQEKKKLKP